MAIAVASPTGIVLDVYAVPLSVRSGVFVPVPDWRRPYQRSWLLFVPTTVVMEYYSNLVIRRRTPQLMFVIAISKFCVSVLVSFLFSALVGGPVGLNSDFAGVKGIAAGGLYLPVPDGAHNFVLSVGFFQIISGCNVSTVKAFPAYIWLLEVYWLHEVFTSWYPNKAAVGELSPVPPHSVCGQKRATDCFFITGKAGGVSVGLEKSRLTTISEARSPTVTAGVQLDNPVPLHADKVYASGDNGEATHVEELRNL